MSPTPTSQGQSLPTRLPRKYKMSKDGRFMTITSKFSIGYEAELNVWLSTNTSIPVAKWLREGYDENLSKHVAMIRLPSGKPLSECWSCLNNDEQASVIAQLKGYTERIRAIQPTQLPGSSIRDVFLDKQDGETSGTFEKATDFLEAIANRMDAVGGLYNPGPTRKVIRALGALADITPDQRLLFTHGNMSPDNIIVDDKADIVAILDWSQAGYAPVFWEYVKAYLEDDDSEFYVDGVIDRFLHPYPIHLSVMAHAHDIIW